jgi:peptidoglycan/xylan/chitin deacetylase (PgdA/CDA1 family)
MLRAKAVLGAVAGPYIRRLTRESARVLMYHRFGGPGDFRRLELAIFEQQMAYLKKNFRPMALVELARRLNNSEGLPDRSVVVTVDDGYADFCRIAAPVLARHEIPATLFVVSDFIDRKLWLWYDAIHYLVHAANRDGVSLNLGGRRETVRLVDRTGRNRLWEKIADDVLPLSMQAKWARIEELASDLAVTLPQVPTPEYEAAHWEELRQLDPKWFDVGCHTKSHAILSQCDKQELCVELENSKNAIEDRLERAVRSFCYPNGQRNDYDDRCVQAVRAAGYECAVVAHGGLVRANADPYRIERFSPSTALTAFRNELNGIPELRSRLAVVLGVSPSTPDIDAN